MATTESRVNGSAPATQCPPVQQPKVEEESTNALFRLILNHYRYTGASKSIEQLEKEKWLLPKVPFNRWMCLPAAVIIQFCVGSLYAWSVFNQPIEYYIFGEIKNLAPITFYIACGFLGSSAAVMGPWLERNGPKVACILGTLLFCTGHLLSALALYLKQIWLVFLGYGVIGGCGIGICYISPVSCLQKWFPDRRGLASGFAVCGFGAGSIVLAKVQLPLIKAVGLPLTFVVLGGIYFFVMGLAALILRTPPPDFSINGMRSDRSMVVTEVEKENDKNFNAAANTLIINGESGGNQVPPPPPLSQQQPTSPSKLTLLESLNSRDFRLIYLAFFANILFGLCAISRLSNIVTDIFGRSAEEASTIVSINGGFNLGGRLAFSIASDYIGRKSSYIIMLTSQLIIVALFSVMTSYGIYYWFVPSILFLTACYGGGFGTIPAFLTDKFGPTNIGAVHGIALTAWSLSGIAGGLVFTAVFDSVVALGYSSKDALPYNVNSWWICCIVVVGWTSLLFVEPTEKDLNFRQKVSQFFKRNRDV